MEFMAKTEGLHGLPTVTGAWAVPRSCERDAWRHRSALIGERAISESIHGVPRDIYFEQLLGHGFRRMLAVSPRS